MTKVRFTYFKDTGKYYAEGFCYMATDEMNEIHQNAKELQRIGKLPGLAEKVPGTVRRGGRDFFIVVDAPGHTNEVPMLILPLIKPWERN
jgi:hypothetical protein